MRIVFSIILILSSLGCFAQKSGTFKVSKKKEVRSGFSENKFKSRFLFIGAGTTFAGKSSPSITRSYNLHAGLIAEIKGHATFSVGFSGGKANPNINYEGYTLGGYLFYRHRLLLGAGYLEFPIELHFARLFNGLDANNLDQRSISFGISKPILRIPGSHITLLGSYQIDKNDTDTFKGLYPTLRIDYYF